MAPYDWANGGSVDVSLDGECSFTSMGVDAILGNGCEIRGQNYIALLQGSEMSAGFHNRSLILGI